MNRTIRLMHIFFLRCLKILLLTTIVCFMKVQEFFNVIITLYVGDLILVVNDLILLKETKDNFAKKFEMVDLSEI